MHKHHLTIISIDGHSIEAKPVDVIQVEPGLVLNKHVYKIMKYIKLETPICLCV